MPIDAKRQVNEAERTASRDHLARLGGGGNQTALGAGSPHLSMVRDLKMVNSHLASIGYAVIEPIDRATGLVLTLQAPSRSAAEVI